MTQPPVARPDRDGHSVLAVISRHYAPSAFLLWATYGVFRPVFDPSASFGPMYWYVGGACLLTLVGRWVTRDIDSDGDDDDDEEEPLDEKWRFSLSRIWRAGRR